jgi:hypothetical protein
MLYKRTPVIMAVKLLMAVNYWNRRGLSLAKVLKWVPKNQTQILLSPPVIIWWCAIEYLIAQLALKQVRAGLLSN